MKFKKNILKYMFIFVIIKLWGKINSVVRDNAHAHVDEIINTLGFSGIVELIAAIEGDAAYRLLAAKGARLGTNLRIHRGLTVYNADDDFSRLDIGNDCHLGPQVLLDIAAPIRLGNRVTLSMRTMILTHMNAGNCNSEAAVSAKKKLGVIIEDDVYIGAGTVILPGVTIGKGALIGAASVVTRNVPPNSVMAGVPAKCMRTT